MINAAITIDVESDWGGRLDASQANCQGLEKAIPYILNFFKKNNVKATFFISSEVVASYADLLCEIKEKGHELASHGFKHNLKYDRITRNKLVEQVTISKRLLEDNIGVSPIGFRTPQLRINPQLHAILRDQEFKYDSSMASGFFPTRYNNLQIPNRPFIKDGLWEIPIPSMPYLRVPMGLLWANAMGFDMFKFLLNKSKRDTIIIYLHPFDLIENKSKTSYNFIITSWYNFKIATVKTTFEQIIAYLANRTSITTMKELIKI
jgi:peptidoglycan/xylan/chitin deacetylase (PgdA/CDA1 family)